MNKRGGKATRAKRTTINKNTEKSERIPVHMQDRMKYEERPGYKRRVVNDVQDGNRIKIFQKAGWTIVEQPNQDLATDSMKESSMGTAVKRAVGGGVTGILMEIPKKFFNEDQKLKQKRVDRKEEELKRRKSNEPDSEMMYGEVKIQR